MLQRRRHGRRNVGKGGDRPSPKLPRVLNSVGYIGYLGVARVKCLLYVLGVVHVCSSSQARLCSMRLILRWFCMPYVGLMPWWAIVCQRALAEGPGLGNAQLLAARRRPALSPQPQSNSTAAAGLYNCCRLPRAIAGSHSRRRLPPPFQVSSAVAGFPSRCRFAQPLPASPAASGSQPLPADAMNLCMIIEQTACSHDRMCVCACLCACARFMLHVCVSPCVGQSQCACASEVH